MRKDGSYRLTAREVVEFNADPDRVKEVIQSAGSGIASVHFHKRSTGELRKMAYRLHVKNPSGTKAPSGMGDRSGIGTAARKTRDDANGLITVYDVNVQTKDADGKIVRGGYRMVPLDGVTQVTVKGNRYVFRR
jgi:hypothetical protein